MKKQYLLTFEFRYYKVPSNPEYFSGNTSKTITIGIYDTIEEAVKIGNENLEILKSKGFEIRHDDYFKIRGLFGRPNTLATNTCYPRGRAQYFGKITTLDYTDLSDMIDQTDKDIKAYRAYKLKEEN